jgi:hypothetical protein
MSNIQSLLISAVLLFAAAPAVANGHESLPAPYKGLIAHGLPDGLQLVALRPRAPDGPGFRDIDILQADGKSVLRRVSVAHGYTAMYSYPGEGFYVNLKVETSQDGYFDQDREHVLAALAGINGDAQRRAAGRDLVDAGAKNYRGVEYHYTFAKSAVGNGVAVFFLPERKIVVTAYILGRKGPPASSAPMAQHSFVRGFIDALSGPAAN